MSEERKISRPGELDRLALARVADGRHAAFVRGALFGGRAAGTENIRQDDRYEREPRAQHDHDEDGEPALHSSEFRGRIGL
jgi:hypothetical protein